MQAQIKQQEATNSVQSTNNALQWMKGNEEHKYTIMINSKTNRCDPKWVYSTWQLTSGRKKRTKEHRKIDD